MTWHFNLWPASLQLLDILPIICRFSSERTQFFLVPFNDLNLCEESESVADVCFVQIRILSLCKVQTQYLDSEHVFVLRSLTFSTWQRLKVPSPRFCFIRSTSKEQSGRFIFARVWKFSDSGFLCFFNVSPQTKKVAQSSEEDLKSARDQMWLVGLSDTNCRDWTFGSVCILCLSIWVLYRSTKTTQCNLSDTRAALFTRLNRENNNRIQQSTCLHQSLYVYSSCTTFHT